jgi:hypothetical protein
MTHDNVAMLCFAAVALLLWLVIVPAVAVAALGG